MNYVWLETDAGRGANEIASALKDYIGKLEKSLLTEKSRNVTLRLFSDSCGSQNKNCSMMAMLVGYLEGSKVFKENEKFLSYPWP